jgi:60S ribosome subunit biogenesis protein NIP7
VSRLLVRAVARRALARARARETVDALLSRVRARSERFFERRAALCGDRDANRAASRSRRRRRSPHFAPRRARVDAPSPSRARRARETPRRGRRTARLASVRALDAPRARAMRPLEESELEQVLAKLFQFVGKNIERVLRRADAPHSLRLHKKRVYYVRDEVMRRATSVGREQLVALGTCLGKFTHSDKFRLTIGALDVLAAHAKYKMWVKPTSEMGFMYGNHLLKSGLGRISENTPANAGVVIYSMADVPVGFGVAAKSTQDCRKLDPSAIVAYHLADVGEYLRAEDTFVSGKKD